MVTAMRVVFFGTPGFAVPTLEQLCRSQHEVVAVITQPDRPRGRGQRLVPGEVKRRALDVGLPVLQPAKLKDDAFLATVEQLRPDVGVVAAYGRILSQRLLDIPRLGMINVHASLLPRWRGAAPIHRAILAGDARTGVTIMRMVLALDAGPSLAAVETPIDPDETSVDLERRLATIGSSVLVETLDRLAVGPVTEIAQSEEGVTYAERLDRRDSQVNWTRPAPALHNQIRGLQPWPLAGALLRGTRVAFIKSTLLAARAAATTREGTVVGVSREGLDVQTGDGVLRLDALQPEGRSPMAVRDFLNGRRVEVGDRFEPLPSPQ
jgi:methionyl-tRNA formyltransferase